MAGASVASRRTSGREAKVGFGQGSQDRSRPVADSRLGRQAFFMKSRHGHCRPPTMAVLGRGYVAGEHARKVSYAESRIEELLIAYFKAANLEQPTASQIKADAKIAIRLARTGWRSGQWFIKRLSFRAGKPIGLKDRKSLLRELRRARHPMVREPWRSPASKGCYYGKLTPRVTGLHILA